MPFIRSHGIGSDATSTKSTFAPGDVLFGKLRPNLRKVALARFSGLCSTDILVLQPHEASAGWFVLALLQSETVLRHAVGTSAGTKMPRTTWRDLSRCPVCLPPLPEQRAIAEALQSADEVIERSRAVIEQLAQVKKALMQELLTRGLPGRHTRFKLTPVGEAPEEWQAVTLASVLAEPLRNGRCPGPGESGGVHELVGLSAIEDGRVLNGLPTSRIRLGPGEADALAIRTGDILMVRATGSKTQLGRAGLVGSPGPLWVCPAMLIRIRANVPSCLPEYLALALNGVGARRQVSGLAKTTTAVWSVSQQDVAGIIIPLPPVEQQKVLCGLVSSVDAHRDAEQAVLEAAQALKSGLMRDLLTGRRRWKGASTAPAAGDAGPEAVHVSDGGRR